MGTSQHDQVHLVGLAIWPRSAPSSSGAVETIRYASVFRYYGNAIEDGIEPLAFCGVSVVAALLAATGAWLFARRDIAA